MIFASKIQNMSTFLSTLIMLTSLNLSQDTDFKEQFVNKGDFRSLFSIILSYSQVMAFAVFTSILTYLYSKAAVFQKTTNIQTPDKVHILQQIEEIQEQVKQIFQHRKQDDHNDPLALGEMIYRNTKIVAWLLNRPKIEQQLEREEFFKGLN